MRYIREYTTCQQKKVEYSHPVGFLQPLPIPTQKWEIISMDFFTGLQRVQGKDGIFVVVVSLNKFAHLFSISMEHNAHYITNFLFKEVFRLHGLPKNIVSDRDNRFKSTFR
jgi:hypothetical protein